MPISAKQLKTIHAANPSRELWTLAHGAEFPYESGDDEYGDSAPDSVDWAHVAARGVLANLTDRRGIKWGFEEVDHEIRGEIVETLSAIIRKAHVVAA